MIRAAGIFRQNVAPEIYQEEAALDLLPFSVDLKLHRFIRAHKIDGGELNIGEKFCAARSRNFFQFARHGPHSAHRHFPFAGLVPDQVIEKTPVLHERRIVRMGEHADLRVGQDQAADEIVLQMSFDRDTERFLGEASPRFARHFIGLESALEFFPGDERLQH